MKYVIDCHGLNHKDAIDLIESKILLASTEGSFTMELITGNSTLLRNKIIREILEEWDFNYYIPSRNLGVIIVTHVSL
jgi:hypothetical protein